MAARAAQAKALGCDGIELPAAKLDLKTTRTVLEETRLPVACIAAAIALEARPRHDQLAIAELQKLIRLAGELNCPLLRIWDTPSRSGRSMHAAALALATVLSPLADLAAEHNVLLLVENRISLRTADSMWNLMEATSSHPALAVAWNLLIAAKSGEGPLLSVPTLNSRIQYALVCDAQLPATSAHKQSRRNGELDRPAYRAIGAGELQVANCVSRLRGIGYEGWIAIDFDPTLIGDIPDPEMYVPQALIELRQWSTPPAAKIPKPRAIRL